MSPSSRTFTIAAAILVLLAGTAWWVWQPDPSSERAGSHSPANAEASGAMREVRGSNSGSADLTTSGRAVAEGNAPAAADVSTSAALPSSSDSATSIASRASEAGAHNGLSTLTRAADEGMDDDHKDELPLHWLPCGPGRENGQAYLFASDSTTAVKGNRSASITSITQKLPHGAGWCQWVDASAFRGKRVAYSAFLRTENAAPGANLDLRVDDARGRVIANTYPRKEIVPGTMPWTRYTIVIDIPDEAHSIQVSAYLVFKGKLWFDDATLEIVDDSWPLTQEFRRPVVGGYAPPQQQDVRGPDILNASFEDTAPPPAGP